MVGRHCPPNRHGLSTSYRKGEFARGGVRWVDVSETKWWPRGVEGGHRWPTPLSTPRNTRRRETRGNGTNDRWDSAPLRAWHRYIPPLFSPLTHKKCKGGHPPLDIDGRATPPGGHDARGSHEKF